MGCFYRTCGLTGAYIPADTPVYMYVLDQHRRIIDTFITGIMGHYGDLQTVDDNIAYDVFKSRHGKYKNFAKKDRDGTGDFYITYVIKAIMDEMLNGIDISYIIRDINKFIETYDQNRLIEIEGLKDIFNSILTMPLYHEVESDYSNCEHFKDLYLKAFDESKFDLLNNPLVGLILENIKHHRLFRLSRRLPMLSEHDLGSQYNNNFYINKLAKVTRSYLLKHDYDVVEPISDDITRCVYHYNEDGIDYLHVSYTLEFYNHFTETRELANIDKNIVCNGVPNSETIKKHSLEVFDDLLKDILEGYYNSVIAGEFIWPYEGSLIHLITEYKNNPIHGKYSVTAHKAN